MCVGGEGGGDPDDSSGQALNLPLPLQLKSVERTTELHKLAIPKLTKRNQKSYGNLLLITGAVSKNVKFNFVIFPFYYL